MCFQRHRGLYDDWKTVPFVDETDNERKDLLGEYVNNLVNASDHSQDKFLELYNKYNKEHHRVVGVGEDSAVGDDNNDKSSPENEKKEEHMLESIKPLEGGLEDMTEMKPKSDKASGDLKIKKGKSRNGKRHRKSREERRKKREHKNSVKKDLSRKQKRKEKREKKRADKLKAKDTISEKDALQLNVEKFYKEHPNAEKNVDTITDGTVDAGKEDIVQEIKTTAVEDVKETTSENTNGILSESYDDDHMKEAYDDQDDADDALEKFNDSQSNDASSENYNDYYDYYDEDGDSSYSSSEMRAEQEMLSQTPSDWFKNMDYHMQGDQPAADNDDVVSLKKNDVDKIEDLKQYDKIDTSSIQEKSDNSYKNKEKEDTTASKPVDDVLELHEFLQQTNDKAGEPVPKTEVEASTSPNPPTSKVAEAKPSVTNPTYSQWKERVETWNLIESKPVGKWWRQTLIALL